ncbi:hypothetical protein HGM15179_017576 [Zosterops borbonicus]|uniref:Cadherin domain-containing protein n=1 Tax=Zosterops borbonicus TaxID=364589 RepID=A0A8K1G0K5_9PASS|nr:hypothetical protein HGM15179_017576 [Zosterops borbonicus]
MRAETARYSVPEEAERGSFVANIAQDLGLTGEELLARHARLVPEGEKQYLELNQHSGDLVVREQMDREELCGQSEPCLLRFEVLLESPLQSFRAEVRLTDINDNSPVFLNKEIVLKMPELTMPGTRFLLESAHDPDVGNNSLQYYSISSNKYFHVYTQRRNDGGRYAELVLDRALDREQQAEVAFSITAVDGGTPPRSGTALIRVVVLDVNDNIPVFTQTLYKVSVMENNSQDTLVVTVSASDLDAGTNGEIVYSIIQNSEENLQKFKINPVTGQIRLEKPLDYEEKKTYEIDVQATDGGGLSTHCKVEVQVKDVNDNAPEVIITSLTSALSEAAPPNTVVALFNVRDRDSGDNGRTTCELTGEQPFRITLLAADAYALVTSETLDREQVEEYNVTVRARDEGSPALSAWKTLLVRLLDVNDNAPTFTQAIYTMVMSENEPAGRSLGRLSATDLDAGENARVKYALVPPPTGSLAAASFVSVDAESGTVHAGNNSLQYYSISSNKYFHVYTQRRNDGGRYAELVLDRALDREQQAEVAFSITAVDGGTPPRSGTALIRVVVLDVNDNIPVFTQTLYKVSVMENNSQDTLVVTVSASDLDAGTNGEIVYSIIQNSEENLQKFKINPVTGQIRLEKPLDYEEKKTYEIDVQATDGGGLSTHCKVEVQVKDVNDNAPEVIITSLTSALSEAAPPNTVVALFNVRDRDSGDNGRTTCELTGEQPFRITLLAADAYALVTSETLDREQVEEYNVTVRARDEGSPALSAWKTLLVRLLDVNDNAPTFTQAIYTMVMSENEPAGRSLGRLSATDLDAGENARVKYALVPPPTGSLAAASFVSVDAESGTVRSLRPLDYEKVRAFEVTVRAADGGSPPLSAQAVLRVLVRDENDNAPALLHPPPDSSAAGELVPRWAPSGYLVAKVVAVDADAGQNAWLSYELAKATEPGLFRVGLHSGEVRTARAVTERDAARQRLIVLVRDRGQPPRSATATLAVALVHDFSDAFRQLGHDPASGQQPQVAEEELLTTYLIASLCCVSSLFLFSILVFTASTLCKARVRAELPPPSPSCCADGDFASDAVGVGSTGTLTPAYRYEMYLTSGSGRSEFQFLRPILPSPHSNAEVGLDKDEEPLRHSQPACDREAHAASTATPPF